MKMTVKSLVTTEKRGPDSSWITVHAAAADSRHASVSYWSALEEAPHIGDTINVTISKVKQ